jgi:hypothetical protein
MHARGGASGYFTAGIVEEEHGLFGVIKADRQRSVSTSSLPVCDPNAKRPLPVPALT